MRNQSHLLQILRRHRMDKPRTRIIIRGGDQPEITANRTRVSSLESNYVIRCRLIIIVLVFVDAEKENQAADSDVILRRTHSFESDEM